VTARLAEVARGEAVVGIGALNIGSLRRGLKLIAQMYLRGAENSGAFRVEMRALAIPLIPLYELPQ